MPRITSFFTRQTPVDNPQRAQSPVGAVRNERTPPADQTQRAPGPLSGLSRRQPNAGARSETSRPRLAADVLEFDELGAALESSEIPQLDPSERRRFNVDTTASAQLVSAGGRVLQRSTQLRSYESVLLEWRDQCAANADQWREAWISANESVTGAELNLEVALRISAAHLARAASHNVASLDLSYLPLPRFPEQTYRFGHLQDMSIAGAGLLELPESISDLANLRTLTLSQNPIGALPASISRLGELQELTIFSCPNLTELPEHLAIRNTAGQREGLVKLRTLTLSRTGIRSLPSSLEYLKDLTHLKINSSPLTELNTSIHRLPCWKRLICAAARVYAITLRFRDSSGRLGNSACRTAALCKRCHRILTHCGICKSSTCAAATTCAHSRPVFPGYLPIARSVRQHICKLHLTSSDRAGPRLPVPGTLRALPLPRLPAPRPPRPGPVTTIRQSRKRVRRSKIPFTLCSQRSTKTGILSSRTLRISFQKSVRRELPSSLAKWMGSNKCSKKAAARCLRTSSSV